MGKRSCIGSFCLGYAFRFREIVVSCHRMKNRKFLWYNSVDAIALVGTVFCRSNKKTNYLKSYI